ncbi:TraB/GumN family protein [Aurantiacibacter gilvus]|uniref:TraB/GumN family protein n=1 Tax=Aurantiacibacter gilvus TaxID=3139141 RepID=A0ABU9IDI0_9SPHN
MISRLLKALPPAVALLAAALALPAAAQEEDRYAFTQDYDPAPAIWRLADEDTTIYMLGTIHLLPEGFRWRNPQLDAIIDEAEVLVVETSDADSEGALEAMSPKFQHLLANRTPTSRQLSAQSRPLWRELVAMSGMPFEVVDSMPLMVALLGFGQASIEGDPSSYDYGVETVLEAEFSETGRPIESIEDFGQVMYGLFRVNDAEAVRELDMQLRGWGGKSVDGLYDEQADELTGDAYWAMEHAWARGEVAEDFDLGFGEGAIGEAFSEVLLNRRNSAWAEWLDTRLDQPGTVLLAVGAGHFEGPDSVLEKLRTHGLEAERIN